MRNGAGKPKAKRFASESKARLDSVDYNSLQVGAHLVEDIHELDLQISHTRTRHSPWIGAELAAALLRRADTPRRVGVR